MGCWRERRAVRFGASCDTRYGYDANGQVAEARFGDGASERFSYDAAKTVAGVRVEGPAVGPGLDGLLSWRSTPGGVVQLARGPHGESIALTHDACGRVITRRVERRGFLRPEELSWTAQRHPALVSAGARAATQIWTWPEVPTGSGDPGDGRPPVVGTHFTWDGDVVAEEAPLRLDGGVDWGAATRWHYEPGGFLPLAKQTAGGELLPIVTDHLGTPREMFDEGGGLRWAASFTTWGVVRGVRAPPPRADNDDGQRAIYSRGDAQGGLVLAPTSEHAQFDCPIRFQGQWEDGEAGISYNRNRYYLSEMGQYLSSDPIGLRADFRPYAYALNLLCSIDPFGLSTTLYRVVSPAEAQDNVSSGQFRPSPGELESKYFSNTEAGARQYGEMAKRFGENEQTIVVKTRIAIKRLHPI